MRGRRSAGAAGRVRRPGGRPAGQRDPERRPAGDGVAHRPGRRERRHGGPSFAATLVSGPTQPVRRDRRRRGRWPATPWPMPCRSSRRSRSARAARSTCRCRACWRCAWRGRMSAQYDVVILGGGLAGLTLAIQLRQRIPGIDVPCSSGAPSGARSGVQGRRIDGGDRRALFRRRARPARAPGRRTDPQVRLPLLLLRRPRRPRTLHRTGCQPRLPTPSWQLDRGRFENFLGEQARALGVEFHDGAVVAATVDAGGRAARRITIEPNAMARPRRSRALGRRCLRPRRPAQAQARPRPSQRPRRQRGVVARRRRRRRRLVRRSGMAARAAIRPIAGARPTTCAARATGSG